MHIFERQVNGRRYRIAAQSIWDSVGGRSVARQVVLGPALRPPIADLAATRTVGTRAIGDVGALIWVAEQLDLIAHIDRACGHLGSKKRSFRWRVGCRGGHSTSLLAGTQM